MRIAVTFVMFIAVRLHYIIATLLQRRQPACGVNRAEPARTV